MNETTEVVGSHFIIQMRKNLHFDDFFLILQYKKIKNNVFLYWN